jgi:hypothetical protein
MNERIESLIELAEVWNTDGDVEVDLYKFAELIVLECASVCDDLQKWPSSEPRHCASDIKKHFGIEESPTNGETK